jgi:hypothetical protein
MRSRAVIDRAQEMALAAKLVGMLEHTSKVNSQMSAQ